MTGTCSNCFHFSDDLVEVREGEKICAECMMIFTAEKLEDEGDFPDEIEEIENDRY